MLKTVKRSSSVRNFLKPLELPENTLRRATRKVSFASSNIIKPFAADPKKKEEVNHTDSTKSSCSASADLNEEREPDISPPVVMDCINSAPEEAQAINNERLGDDFMKIINETVKKEKSCLLADITPSTLVSEEFDQSGLAESPNQSNIDVKTIEDDSMKNASSSNSSGVGNYTLRSQMVLTNISRYLVSYEPAVRQRNENLALLNKEIKENFRQIEQLRKTAKVNIVDLEERYKQDVEKNSSCSSSSEVVASTDEDLGTPAMSKLLVPKTIRERICELAKKAVKYWEFVKIEEDYCYFYTLFGTLPFKAHIHPELGIVYSVTTYTNLAGFAPHICRYQLKSLQHNLQQENLLSVLGDKFDIFSLLDYVYMCMDDAVEFNAEYDNLIREYEESHHFRMNPDGSISFEILNVKSIIFWIITVKMPLNNKSPISKEDVTAVHKVGQKVNEEHIKRIAENTPRGLNFLRKFIEGVNEYVNRMGRRLRK